MQFVIFVIYEVQPDSVPRCLTSYSNRQCFGLIQNKKLRCISNHSALSSAIIEFAFPGHKFAPRRKIFSVLQTTIVRSELPGRSSMYGFFHTTPKKYFIDRLKWSLTTFYLRDRSNRRDTDTTYTVDTRVHVSRHLIHEDL